MASWVRFMRDGTRSSASMLREVSTAIRISSELALDFSSTYPQRGEARARQPRITAPMIRPVRVQYSQPGMAAVSSCTRALLTNSANTRSRWSHMATLPPSTSSASRMLKVM